MTLRFLLDEDLSPRIAAGLRDRAFDAISVHEIGRTALSDGEQLAFATDEGRVLVTYNRTDYQVLDANWQKRGQTHAGILWGTDQSIRRQAYGDVIQAIEFTANLYGSIAGLCLPLSHPPAS